MAHLLYVTDKPEIVISSASLTPASSGEVSVYKNWLQSKLHRTINRGQKLRVKKGVITSQPKELKVIDVKISSRKRPSVVLTKAKVINKKPKQNEKCSTRIVQLAAPSKRHCIATWRQRADKLPPEMLDRLKMYVNDELPEINVSDALNSFQIKKKSKRVKKVEHKVVNDNLQTKKLCVKFSNRIVKRLMRPLNIVLKDGWRRISDEVNIEISKLMRTNVKLSNFNRRMNEEIANKITVWIADILHNAENVLLERDLKDLDDQEGPLLDFIEDIIDEAVEKTSKIALKTQNFVQTSLNINEKVSGVKIESIVPNDVKDDTANEVKMKDNDKLTEISDEDLLSKIDESIVFNEQDNAENNSIIPNKDEENSLNAVENIDITTIDEKSIQNNIELLTPTNSIISGVDQKDLAEHASNHEGVTNLIKATIENANVTDNIENKTKSDKNENGNNLEIKGKSSGVTVKINEENNYVPIDIRVDAPSDDISETGKNVNEQVNEKSNRRIPTLSQLNISLKKLNESITSFQGKKIKFSSPKRELLSDADEDWPSDLNMLTVKSSYHASKSVTSLGNIYENEDERVASPKINSSDEER